VGLDSPISEVVSGALFYEMRMSVLSNNLANIQTAGFKEDRISFRLPSEGEEGASPAEASPVVNPQAFYQGHPVESYTNFSPGRVEQSGNPLDFALEEGGFFCVLTPDGERYTRKGNFTLDTEGRLITQEGYPVQGLGGDILLEGPNVDVDGQGNISMDGVPVDTLKRVDFEENAPLLKTGASLFVPAGPDARPLPAEGSRIMQGFLERSNVDAVQTMTEMIQVLRGYESYQKILQILDETTVKAVNEVGRVS
jgi:flagellar basal-body rod protein FlgG